MIQHCRLVSDLWLTRPTHLDQLESVVVHLADRDGGAAVAVEAVEEDRHVDVEDVALLQLPGVGDTVAGHVVH